MNRRQVLGSLLEGLMVFAVVGLGFWIGLQKHGGLGDARTLAFCGLVFGSLGLIVASRAGSTGLWRSVRVPNPAFWTVLGGASAVLTLLLLLAPLRSLFSLSPLHWDDLAISAGLTAVLVGALLLAAPLSGGPRAPADSPGT
jgi:Ca2+-transporting ATPase